MLNDRSRNNNTSNSFPRGCQLTYKSALIFPFFISSLGILSAHKIKTYTADSKAFFTLTFPSSSPDIYPLSCIPATMNSYSQILRACLIHHCIPSTQHSIWHRARDKKKKSQEIKKYFFNSVARLLTLKLQVRIEIAHVTLNPPWNKIRY